MTGRGALLAVTAVGAVVLVAVMGWLDDAPEPTPDPARVAVRDVPADGMVAPTPPDAGAPGALVVPPSSPPADAAPAEPTSDDAPPAAGSVACEVLVVDPAGRPLPTALLYPAGTSLDEPVARADDAGRLRWSEPAPGREVLVAEPFHLPARLDVAAVGAWPVTVVLARAAVLVVEVRQTGTPPLSVLRVSAISDRPLLHDEDAIHDLSDAPEMTGWTGAGITGADGSGERWMTETRTGRYELRGVRAGVPFEVVVGGAAGEEILRRSLELEEGEQRLLEVVVDVSSRSLSGVVTDAAGDPVRRAKVELWPARGSDNSWRSTTTADDGSYRMEEIASETASVRVTADGHAAFVDERHDLVLVPVLDVVLTDDRPVDVEVVHVPSGRPAREAHVLWRWAIDTESGWDEVAPGRWRVTGLPTGRCELEVLHQGLTFPLVREPGRTLLRVEVPETGSLRAGGLVSVADARRVSLRALPRDGGEPFWGRIDDGAAEIREIPPGPYRVEQVRRGRGGAPDVVLASGQVDVLEGATVDVVLRSTGAEAETP